jgi:hypothetical protein
MPHGSSMTVVVPILPAGWIACSSGAPGFGDVPVALLPAPRSGR